MSYPVRLEDLDDLKAPGGAAAARPWEAQQPPRQPAELPTAFYQHRQLGRYRLCLKVASGGMANVYLACVDAPKQNEVLQRVVALKVLHPGLTNDPQFVDMFFDEARIASLIHHPFVCSVLDFGSAEGTYYLAMELLVGESLKQIRRVLGRRNSEVEPIRHAAYLARLFADACEGLHAAHELSDDCGRPLEVVHRDVSPDNLFMTFDGIVKVVDFGVAQLAGGRHRTRTGIIKGKMDYVAPELLRGERADRRADVWGLGVVLWEMVTLRRLFHRSTDMATLGAVIGMEVPAPSKIRAGLPKEFDAIVLRALARNQEQRYPTARDLGRDLTRFLVQSGEGVGSAELSDWMAQIFPGGRSMRRQLHQIASRPGSDEIVSHVRQATWDDPASSLSRQASSLIPMPPKSRRRVGRIQAATAAAVATLALVAVLFLRHRASAAGSLDSGRIPPGTPPSQPAVPSDPRQPLVLELAATRETGERRTLLRVRTAPDGQFLVDGPSTESTREGVAGSPARR